ncbi:MAG: DNA polymerase III subunit beta [Oscillospiraceae bacterium]|jgi:DNA polymerase-3 subunit beta|nr:DNA polymerase III subunit beta [Oscillospiraceae bacterium]
MKFTCEKTPLFNAISIVSRTVSPKSSLAFLEGIYLNAGENLKLTGYNLETGITVQVDANVKQGGECVMPTRMFSDIIRKLPDESVLIEVDDSYKVTICAGVSKFQLMATSADEYPQLPKVEEESAVRLPQKALRELISGTIFAVSDDTANAIYTGCLVEAAENAITMVAIDGYRMARRTWHAEDSEFPPMHFVAPSAALRELEKILSDTDDEVLFLLGRKHISFSLGSATLICRLLDGKFVDWHRFIPESTPIHLVANLAELTATIERVSLIVSEKYKSPVRCMFGKDGAQFRTVTTIASANDGCRLAGDGKDTEIGFSCRYMLEALRAVPTDEVCIELSGGLSPILLTPTDDKYDFTYLIQPVRLN